MASVRYEEIADDLVAAVPEFRPVLEEHLRDNGEVLPHVLFGDVCPFLQMTRTERRTETVERVLGFLERALRDGDAAVDNLVSVSFVENFEPRSSEHEDFAGEWPERLRAEFARQRDWRP